MSDAIQKVAQALQTYYAKTFHEHGPTFRGVDWVKEKDALLRYALHVRAMDGRNIRSILDVGCGIGLFYDHLKSMEGNGRSGPETYHGVDALPEMIDAARRRLPGVTFSVGKLEDGLADIPPADFALANGVFTVKGSASDEDMSCFIDQSLDVLWSKCRLGMSFNLMTSSVDYRYDWLYYADPAEVINKLRLRFGRRFLVLHDSALFDAVYVWLKDPAGLWEPGAGNKNGI